MTCGCEVPFVTDAVKNKEIRVRYIPTDLNFANFFTKPLTPKKHTEFGSRG